MDLEFSQRVLLILQELEDYGFPCVFSVPEIPHGDLGKRRGEHIKESADVNIVAGAAETEVKLAQ